MCTNVLAQWFLRAANRFLFATGETGDPDEPVATESPRSNDGQEDGAVATGTEPLDLGTGMKHENRN